MIPEGWAVDSDGRPTTDPVKALGGTLVSAGGYKGWGFGLMSEIFAAGLTGSVNSLDIKGLKSPDGPPHGIGQYYIIIDTKTFTNQFDEKFQKVSDAVSMQPGTRIPGSTRVELSSVDVSGDLWKSVENLT
jgi:(2R)-3-sulfolactate dehydrogenase (NADP+)